MNNEEGAIDWLLQIDNDGVMQTVSHSNSDIELLSELLVQPSQEISSVNAVQLIPQKESSQSSRTEKNKAQLKKSSLAWQYFIKETTVTARCTLCNKVCKHSGNTTNLSQHLMRKHKLFYTGAINPKGRSDISTVSEPSTESAHDAIVSTGKTKLQSIEKLTTIEEAFEHTRSFRAGGKVADKITNAVLFMIVIDKLPLSTVENDGFRSLMKTVAPLYTVPSRKTITRLVDARYEVLKERFIANLAKSDSYCLTCDNWTDISYQSYLGVSVHYLTKELKMESGCIGVFPLNESHTAEYLKDTLNSVTEEFGLDHSKITAIVTDSAANIKKAVRDLLGQDKHLACFAHSLSHLVPSALETMPELRDTIVKVKNIVTLTRKSVVAADELRKLQIRDGKTEGTALKFIQDVPTRWNSTLYMLERFLLLEQYIYPAISKCPKAPDMLRREEFDLLKDAVSLMKPVEQVIKNVSGDSYPTCSSIIPIIHCLEDFIRKKHPSTQCGIEFKRKLQETIALRFKDFEHHKTLAISTILDPRFKKLNFQSPRAASSAISMINEMMKNVKIAETQTTGVSTEGSENEQSDDENIWSFHDSLLASTASSETQNEGLNSGFKQYLTQKPISRTADPLQYWDTFKVVSPSLYQIATKYVSIVGTSVSSERLFSQAGDIKTDNRSRLSVRKLRIGNRNDRRWCCYS